MVDFKQRMAGAGMTISDERLSWLSGPDYIGSEPGQIAAELLAARARITRLERAGDILAHNLTFPVYEPELSAWWNLRGGVDACTVCNPSETKADSGICAEGCKTAEEHFANLKSESL